MSDQILKLCRRLNKFTFDEILLISEVDSEELKEDLNTLLSADKLVLNNGVYTFKNDSEETKIVSNSLFIYYPQHIIELMIRSYCADVPTYKAAFQAGMAEEQVLKFYRYFRTQIYERQYKELESLYINKPQFAKHPKFMGKEANLYMYNNKVYVAKYPFKSEEERHAHNDRAEYKKVYYYLLRQFTHNSVLINMHHKIAEAIWKRNKNFEERFFDLSSLLV